MVRDEIACGKAYTAIAEPGEAENSPIQCEDREFDDTNTPGVDEDIRKRDLSLISNDTLTSSRAAQ